MYRLVAEEKVELEDNPHRKDRVLQVLRFEPDMFVFMATDHQISVWSEFTEEFVGFWWG